MVPVGEGKYVQNLAMKLEGIMFGLSCGDSYVVPVVEGKYIQNLAMKLEGIMFGLS